MTSPTKEPRCRCGLRATLACGKCGAEVVGKTESVECQHHGADHLKTRTCSRCFQPLCFWHFTQLDGVAFCHPKCEASQ